MTKRLQVLLDDEELHEIKRAARQRRLTVAGWVRQALRAAREAESDNDTGGKLAVIRRAAEQAYPTADIDQMLAEIDQGYRT